MRKFERLHRPEPRTPVGRMSMSKVVPWIVIPGMLLILSLEGYQYYVLRSKQDVSRYHIFSTGRGQRKQWVLPDGSLVWLNAASTLRYSSNMPNKDRTVELTGEAFFEVMPKEDIPFRVKARDMEVQVLGTRFDVRSYQEQNCSKVTLADGAVKIIHGKKEAILRKGDQAEIISSISNESKIKITTAIAPETDWKKGYLEFHEDDLSEVLRELSRSFNFDVQYNGYMPNDKFSGSFSLEEPIEEIAKRLNSQDIHVSVSRNNDKTVVFTLRP